MPEADLSIIRDPGSTSIGTPMDHGISHSFNIVLLYSIGAIFECNGADYSAHESGNELKVNVIEFKWGVLGMLDLYYLR